MQTIVRREFPDTSLDRTLLESIAGLWLAWHREARWGHLLPRRSFHRAQVSLWGVPRSAMEAYRTQLARRAARELADSSVEIADADTLTITSPWSEISQPSALALLAGAFVDEEFDGMRLTLRLTAGDWRSMPDGPASKEGTLIIWTELRGGVPLLKAAWPGDLTGRGETSFRFAAWRGEPEFLRAVEHFRIHGAAPKGPGRLFVSAAHQRLRHALRWLLFDVAEQRTLPAFLGRVTFFGVVTALCFAAAKWLASDFLTVLGVLPLAGLWLIVFRKGLNIASRYRSMNASLQRLYSQPQKFVSVDPSAASVWPEVSSGKYTRELEHLGLTRYCDIRGTAPKVSTDYHRVFVWPAERTYVFLNLLYSSQSFRHFPVKAWPLSTTYFSDGTRLIVTSEGGGYRKSRDPLAIQRIYPEADDPATLLELHQATLRRLLAEGKELAPLMSPDELLARFEADAERVREITRRDGYFSWGAATRQSFNLIRREYRERP